MRSLFSHGRPVLLDLFCGAGGASRGYNDAGFAVFGVDINPQPNYPFEFVQRDALSFLDALLGGGEAPVTYEGDERWRLLDFAAIHASPPCQRYSDLAKRNGNADSHPDLIAPVRALLEQTGLPYVIENVEGAPLIDPVLLCGTAFYLGVDGYRLRRHRLFETNWDLSPFVIKSTAPKKKVCWCFADRRPVIDVSGGGPSKAPRLDGKGGRTYKGTADQARAAMEIPWMTKRELNEAIPPAYTEYVGTELIHHALVEAAA